MQRALPEISRAELSAVVRAVRARPCRDKHLRVAAGAFAAILLIFLHSASVAAWNPSQAPVGAPEENQMLSLRQIAVVSSLAVSSSPLAQNALQWRVENGGNGHWYRRLADTGSVPPSPSALSELAGSLGGYLVSYHSAAEEQFVLSSLGPSMVGLFSAAGGSSFQWASGESVSYTNWGCCGCNAGPYPNNSSSTVRLVFQAAYPGCSGTQGFGPPWDDYPPSDWARGIARNLVIIEWSADCNGDGIVDFGQIRDGTLVDSNGNNIPDCCEQGAPCGLDGVEWRLEDGGNGHWYQVRAPTCWLQARAEAESLGGYLATVTTSAEASFVGSILPFTDYWTTASIGGLREQPSDLYTGWRWVTGEPFVAGAVPWMDGNPGCCAPNEYYLCVNRLGFLGDIENCAMGRVIFEFSADCNGDGITDFGQIRSGALADTNGNNIPDCCEFAPLCSCSADVDASGSVNGVDLAAILNVWGTNGGKYPGADVNHDGIVNGSDLAEVLNGWGPCP